MVEIVREIYVREGETKTFTLLFGPGGEWSRVLTSYPDYRGTTLLHDLQNPTHYLIIDLWYAANYPSIMAESDQYNQLLERLRILCQSQTELGVFRLRAEATVRPRSTYRERR